MLNNGKNLEIPAEHSAKTFYNAAWSLDVNCAALESTAQVSGEDCRFFNINGLKESTLPFAKMMKNVSASMNDSDFNYVYILTGTPSGVEISFGVCRKLGAITKSNAWNYGDTLCSSLIGNIPGIRLESVNNTEEFIASFERYHRADMVIGVPTAVVGEGAEKKACERGGIDMLISSCYGMEWRMVIVSEPVSRKRALGYYEAICELYNTYTRSARNSYQVSIGEQESHAVTRSDSHSTANTDGTSGGTSDSETPDARSDHTHTKAGHKDWNKSKTKTDQQSDGTTDTNGNNSGTSVTYDIVHKQHQEIIKYIDDILINRYRSGLGSGMFFTSIYLMSDNISDLNKLAAIFCSIFNNDPAEINPLRAVSIDFISPKNLKALLASDIIINGGGIEQLIYGHLATDNQCRAATIVNSSELATIAGLPECEVVGIPLRHNAHFGLNNFDNGKGVFLGTLLNEGVEMPTRRITIPHSLLNRHILVAGVTGSGKTTTCQELLLQAGYPFLVIEPAKTEYRALLNTSLSEKIKIFTLGNETRSPFRLNPFELLNGENFTSHVDMLTAAFTSAFPMEAAMPQLLEEAIYRCYSMYGWVPSTGKNSYTDNPYTDDGRYFPILQDLVNVIPDVVKDKGFGMNMNGDYIGSLKGRISNLLVGSKGCMLNCRKSIDICTILDEHVVLELDDLRSANDKSFVMGLVLSALSEAVKLRHNANPDFRHITLIEEAHRLLSNPSAWDNGARRSAVESFTDLLAEVRKYGEALIIADQIPNKLAPDVIKNTNTKIVHKLFATDDKDSIGNAMMMDDNQKAHLSNLMPGEAVLFTESTPIPINLMVHRRTDTSSEVSKAQIDELLQKMRLENDKLIADGCLFSPITAKQRCEVDKAEYLVADLFEALGKLPNEYNSDPSKVEGDEKKISTFVNVFERACGVVNTTIITKKELWDQLCWRNMLVNKISLLHFNELEEAFSSYSSLYHSLFEEYRNGNGGYPLEAIKKIKNYGG